MTLASVMEGSALGPELDDGDSGAADTIDWQAGLRHRSTLTGNVTYTFTAPNNAANLLLRVIQDPVGSRLVTWPAGVLWPGGTPPALSTGANAIDIIAFYFDGTNYYGQAAIGFS